MWLLYNIFISLYSTAIRVASLFNDKARQWIVGRQDVFSKIEAEQLSDKQIIWVHCASLGEFEQGRPIIERLKTIYPDFSIFLTFFSPSGYEIRKNYEFADYVYYLPIDTAKNAKRFIELVNPKLVVFVKYEFWYNYINELYNRKIPSIFISVIFRPSQHFFKFWGRWYARQLNKITYLFVQNKQSVQLLDSIKIHHAEISGDTRFDRVAQLPNEEIKFPIVSSFKGDSKLLMAGSTWQPGEKILLKILDVDSLDFKLVIAPHLINKDHIAELLKRFEKYSPILYSKSSAANTSGNRILIIDSIGMLSQLYRYADIAYIGGGFGVGIHNLLEASTFGVPVLFGPNHERFNEAIDLKDNGGGFVINNSDEFLVVFEKLLKDNGFYVKSSEISGNYVANNAGATLLIIEKIKEYLS